MKPADQLQVQQADRLRQAGRWAEALLAYRGLHPALVRLADIQHNMALCCLNLADHAGVLQHARAVFTTRPDAPATLLLQAKAERQLDSQSQRPQQTLLDLLHRLAERPHRSQTALEQTVIGHARLDLAEISLNLDCDAVRSAQWVEPLLHQTAFAERAQLSHIVASLYSREESDERFHERVLDFASQHLKAPAQAKGEPSRSRVRPRPRVGIVSPMLHASPLFFLCGQALQTLSATHDLVFFSRGRKSDWATEVLRGIATEWHAAAGWDAGALYQHEFSAELDVLLEMGGWMDPDSMCAANGRPALRQFKWVGGQAMTSGLDCFDGFIADQWQIPRQAEWLYTEPIVRLRGGYVRFTPPPDFQLASRRVDAGVWGFIGNPVKVVADGVVALQRAMKTHGRPRCLRFIDRRYRYASVVDRVRALFNKTGVPCEFLAPSTNAEFLEEVSRLSAMVDTSPYSAGLTAREALGLGVPILSHPRSKLFSSLHAKAAVAQAKSAQRLEPLSLQWLEVGG